MDYSVLKALFSPKIWCLYKNLYHSKSAPNGSFSTEVETETETAIAMSPIYALAYTVLFGNQVYLVTIVTDFIKWPHEIKYLNSILFSSKFWWTHEEFWHVLEFRPTDLLLTKSFVLTAWGCCLGSLGSISSSHTSFLSVLQLFLQYFLKI